VASDDDPVAELNDAQRLAVLNSVFHPEVGALADLSPLKAFPLGLNVERTLTDGRTVRIGNAAQTLHPVAGQGLNLGMRDAALLADAIARAVASGRDPAAELPAYEERRQADRGAIVALTRRLPGLFATRATPIAIGRSVALAALGAVPELRREFARVLMFGIRA